MSKSGAQPDRPVEEALRDVAEDHRRARAAVEALRAAGDIGSARALARETGVMLEEHMAEEEQGVFHWIIERDPKLGPELERRVEEHEELRKLLAAILLASDEEVRVLTLDLADRLEAHEAAETSALGSVITRQTP